MTTFRATNVDGIFGACPIVVDDDYVPWFSFMDEGMPKAQQAAEILNEAQPKTPAEAADSLNKAWGIRPTPLTMKEELDEF